MILKLVLCCMVLCMRPAITNSLWGGAYLQDMVSRLTSEAKRLAEEENCAEETRKENCDEDSLLKQLACVFVTSPERIILSLTSNCLEDTCREVLDVLNHINTTLADCIPLPADNLYMKLYGGLQYFHQEICVNVKNPESKSKQLVDHQDCIAMLRDDFVDCEGPADWYEKRNKTFVCKQFTDIINCEYIRTALLCGLKPARLVRDFAKAVISKVLVIKCKISSSPPYVADPMPSAAGSRLDAATVHTVLCIFILVYCYILSNNLCH